MRGEGHWVFVGRARAMAHPKAKLNLGLVLCAVYFAILAGLQFAGAMQTGTLKVLLALPILNLLASTAIILRWPFAYSLVIVMVAFQIGVVFIFGRFRPDPLILAQVVAGLAVALYFAEGGRPNLIYRHRYWSTKPQEDADV